MDAIGINQNKCFRPVVVSGHCGNITVSFDEEYSTTEEDKEMGDFVFIKLEDELRINADHITRVSFQFGAVCVELTDAGIKEASAIITMSDGHNIEVCSKDIDALSRLVSVVAGDRGKYDVEGCEYVLNWVKYQQAVNKYSKKEGK